MQCARISTNLTCNQNCVYCNSRQHTDSPVWARPAAVRARIKRAIQQGGREIILTGGEPTLRRDLVDLIAFARDTGAAAVTLETNATLIGAQRAAQLRQAGVTRARVNLAGWGPALDGVTRDPGGFDRTIAGIQALLEATIRVELGAAVVRSTGPLLPALAAGLGALPGVADQIRGVIVRVPVDAPAAGELLALPAAVDAILAMDQAAREAGVDLWLDHDEMPPPCVFPRGGRWAHLFRLGRDGGGRPQFVHPPLCDACLAKPHCPGFSRAALGREPLPALQVIDEERSRRRLMLLDGSLKEAVRREMVGRDRPREASSGLVEERVIRVTFRCNQACAFCFVSTHLPDPPDEDVRRSIEEAAAAGIKVVLSGGEPTLNPRLAEYLRLATRLSRHPVTVQTNAVRLADEAVLADLIAAGLRGVFVSLHGSTSATADAVTGARGTFDRSVAGLDAVIRRGLATVINFVICRRNVRELVSLVRLVAARWPAAALNVSFVAASAEVVPQSRDLVPRYAEIIPELASAVTEAAALGVSIVGFESMCGVPLCVAPRELGRRFAALCDIDP
ncbi:MAG TPA: radical SAM protein, partial [Polyangia bacterium]